MPVLCSRYQNLRLHWPDQLSITILVRVITLDAVMPIRRLKR
jgi:hypothetical protein